MNMENSPPIEGVEHHYSGVILATESGKLVGQRRDNKPGIDNPGKVGTFGGTVEPGEDPRQAAWRELTQEETNLRIDPSDLQPLFEDVAWRELTKEWEGRHLFIARISDADLAGIEVYEGEGWAYINGPDDPDLIDLWRPIVKKAIEVL